MLASTLYELDAPKKAVSLSLNRDLTEKLKKAKINISAVSERALAAELKKTLDEQWLAENAAAFAAYRQRVERDGLFSDEFGLLNGEV